MNAVLALIALSLPASLGADHSVVAARNLNKGTILTEKDMYTEDKELGLDGYIDMQLVRPVYEGRPIRSQDIAPIDLVTRQQDVTVLFKRDALTLSITGKALKAGAIGELVTVRLPGRRSVLSARVTGPGVVEVQ